MSESDPEPELPQEPNSTINLIHRAQRGEDEALNLLFERYFPRVRQFVRTKLGTRLRQRVESVDIVQETFGKAMQGIDTFEYRDKRSFYNFLCKYADNKISEEIRHHWAQCRSLDREVPLVDEIGPGTDETPSQLLAASSVSETVRDCIRELPEAAQESIMLRCFGELTFAEIARLTGRPSEDAARVYFRDTAITALADRLRRRGLTAVDLPS